MAGRFSIHPYTKPVRMHARGAVVLGTRLLRSAPKKPSKAVKACLVDLEIALADIKAHRSEQAGAPRPNLRPLDRSFDSGWVALRARVEPWLSNDHPDAAPLREAAGRVMGAYFALGLGFVQLSYDKEWVESNERIERWKKDPALRKELVLVAGEAFVANVEYQHQRLSEALDLTGERAAKAPDPRALAEAVEAFADALSEYIRVFGGEVNTKSDASIAAFVQALAPLEAYRASQATGAREEDSEDEDPPSPSEEEPKDDTPAPPEEDPEEPEVPITPATDEVPIGHRGGKPLKD